MMLRGTAANKGRAEEAQKKQFVGFRVRVVWFKKARVFCMIWSQE